MTDVTPTPIHVGTPTPSESDVPNAPNAPQAVPMSNEGTEPNVIDTLAIRVTPPTPPTPIPSEDAPLVTDEQVNLTLAALQTAMDKLPVDDTLYIPREVEANMVRRTLLNAYIARLRVEHQAFRNLEPTRVLYRDWVGTLELCAHDLGVQLTEAEAAVAEKAPRAEQRVANLKYALHDVAHGPDRTPSGEVLFDALAQWLTAHNITPLPGEHGVFAGRGGLHSAKARHADTLRAMKLAHAELENTLAAAQALISGEAGRGYTVDPVTGAHPQVPQQLR